MMITGVSMEVIVTIVIVSWVISPTYPGRILHLPLLRGYKSIDPKYQQDIPTVPSLKLTVRTCQETRPKGNNRIPTIHF